MKSRFPFQNYSFNNLADLSDNTKYKRSILEEDLNENGAVMYLPLSKGSNDIS